MDYYYFYIITLALLGVLLGSFAGASVWRLRARQLRGDKAAGEKIDEKEFRRLAPLLRDTAMDDRSRCLDCQHKLAWSDLLPLVSWLRLRGRCRYCGVKIGYFEPLIEVGTALFFIFSFLFWPHTLTDWSSITLLSLWLISGIGLIILFAYDAKWFLLPNRVMFPVIAVSTVAAIVSVCTAYDVATSLFGILLSCVILSGIYYLLYIMSKGMWIGFGDIKLGLALGLLLADWQLAFMALFLANLIGCFVVLPGVVAKRLGRQSHVPFGPMLIAGAWIAQLFGSQIIDYYTSTVLGLI